MQLDTMKRAISLAFIILFLSAFHELRAQSPKVDSLKETLRSVKNDSNKIAVLNELALQLRDIDPDTAIVIATQALQCAKKNDLHLAMARSYLYIGMCHWPKGNYSLALDHYLKSLRLLESIENSHSEQDAYTVKYLKSRAIGGIGLVYWNKGDYIRALSYYFDALKLAESIGKKQVVANLLGNIGIVYWNQGDLPRALEYYFKALKMAEELGDNPGIARHIGNIATIYQQQGNTKESINYFFKALKLNQELKNKEGEAIHLANLGNVYTENKDYKRAKEFFSRALEVNHLIGRKAGVATVYSNLGILSLKLKNTAEAEKYLMSSLLLSDSIGDLLGQKEQEGNLSELYAVSGRYEKALTHYKKFILLRDSIFNEEKTKETVKLEMNYEFEKKETASKMEQEKKDELARAEVKKQRIILLAISAFGLMVLGFAIFAYRSFLRKKKANIEISAQKHIIEEKQKELMDSIHYAKRIQTALIPSEKIVLRLLKRVQNN